MAKWDINIMGPSVINMQEVAPLINRLERKIEVMKLDQKASGSLRYHESNEMLSLVSILKEKMNLKW
jgi:hypothetical protein